MYLAINVFQLIKYIFFLGKILETITIYSPNEYKHLRMYVVKSI